MCCRIGRQIVGAQIAATVDLPERIRWPRGSDERSGRRFASSKCRPGAGWTCNMRRRHHGAGERVFGLSGSFQPQSRFNPMISKPPEKPAVTVPEPSPAILAQVSGVSDPDLQLALPGWGLVFRPSPNVLHRPNNAVAFTPSLRVGKPDDT